MTPLIPRYAFSLGAQLTHGSQTYVLTGTGEQGYDFTSRVDGSVWGVSVEAFAAALSLRGAKLDMSDARSGSRLQMRLGGYSSWESLGEEQRETANVLFSICQAIWQLQEKIKAEKRDPGFRLSGNKLNVPEYRRFICKEASKSVQRTIHMSSPRGGKRTGFFLSGGRTLMKHFKAYKGIRPGEDPRDALVPLTHFQGNRTDKVLHRTRELAIQAWKDVGFDTKQPSVASVSRQLGTLIDKENEERLRNGLKKLEVPSETTLKAIRKELLKPTEIMIAVMGERHARKERGAGSTDLRALFLGEMVEIDECKASLVASAKAKHIWHGLSPETKSTLRDMDKEIRVRLTILVMIDVASRMPLAWVISDQPRTEATLELLRMATRNKLREKRIYGCEGDPMPAIGLGNIRMDNGPALRNPETISAMVGLGGIATAVRTYSPTDKPYIERMFGTIESVLLQMVHGYTGRRAGHLPGYDAKRNGVLDIDELNGILTRYLIDEYPSTPHTGFGMGGRCPVEVAHHINETRGCFRPIDPVRRLLSLGWKQEVTPNSEGVLVFSGLRYNSPELQELRDGLTGKASVFVDPDDLSRAVVLLPRVKEPIVALLQTTCFRSLTMVEMLACMEELRLEDHKRAKIHEDRVLRVIRERRALLDKIGVERRLPRSFATIEECKNKAKSMFAGVQVVPSAARLATTAVGSITHPSPGGVVFRIGAADRAIDGSAVGEAPVVPVPPEAVDVPPMEESPVAFQAPSANRSNHSSRLPAQPADEPPAPQRLGRPKTLGTLE